MRRSTIWNSSCVRWSCTSRPVASVKSQMPGSASAPTRFRMKKDFFILNLVGADAEPGIWLFTDATGLEVHSHLTQDEFFFVDRLINGNHSDGAHLGDQHGVFLVTNGGTDGAAATFFESGTAGRPGRTKGI